MVFTVIFTVFAVLFYVFSWLIRDNAFLMMRYLGFAVIMTTRVIEKIWLPNDSGAGLSTVLILLILWFFFTMIVIPIYKEFFTKDECN